jgi:predicted Rossmann fold flavoprotein
MDTNKYDIIVIGGGASGMMAAAVAAEHGAEVILLEKNKSLGNKLAISGGGRCNILNAEDDERLLLSNYGTAGKFLFSAFSQFGMQDTYDYFEMRGLKLKVENKKRAFPVTDSALDVVKLLEGELSKYNVDIRTKAEVQSIYAVDGEIKYIKVDGERILARAYILATGGSSRPETGSTGDGFKWLKSMGHDVNEPTPNVTPLAVTESWVKDVSGVSAKSADVIFYSEGKRSFKIHGDILFTHFGISGPTVLNNAYKVAELLEQGSVTAEVDCFPELNEKELDQSVRQTIEEHHTKQLKNTLCFIVPGGLNKALTELLKGQLDLEIKNSELSKINRLKVVKLLKAMPLTIERLMGFEKAVVADGGLSLRDIDTRTMQSKKIKNLYVTGDLLDINRPSGGYSLQLCWTTGYLAGVSGLNHKSELV